MATIFAYPNPTGSGNCAILSSQENYFAPFIANIGNWTQIRVSAFLSFCGTGGFNSQSLFENVANTASNLSFYWGVGSFISSYGLVVPLASGSNFIGISTYGQTNTYLLTPTQVSMPNGVGNCVLSFASASIKCPIVSSTNSTYAALNIANNMGLYFQPTGNTGNLNYCVATTMVFTISGKGQTGQQMFVNVSYDATGNNINNASYTDVGLLRSASNNLAGSGIAGNPSISLYYTTGLSAVGGPLPQPDTVYFHSPFNNNLLRIHNLIVEKFY